MQAKRFATTVMGGLLMLGSASLSHAEDPDIIAETVLEGEEFDSGRAIALDAADNAYVLGYTVEFGDHDMLVVKVDPAGEILWTRSIGGTEFDLGIDLAVNHQGDIVVVGRTQSADFPMVNAMQPVKNGPSDGVVLTLDDADGTILQSTYFGGSRNEEISSVAIGDDGTIYTVGSTGSIDLPLMNPIQDELTLIHCFCDDIMITAFTPAVDAISFSTYLGAGFRDQGREIALGPDGSVYIAGITRSPDDFPLVNPAQSVFAGGIHDLFVAKLDLTTPALVYSTYVGGSGSASLGALAVDPSGRAIITGSTAASDFPTTVGAFQPDYVGSPNACPAGFSMRDCYDAFVTILAADGGSFAYGTYLGGSNDDEARDLVIDSDGRVHLAGYSFSSDFPPDGLDTFGEIFTATFSADLSTLERRFSFDSPTSNAGHGIALDSNGNTVLTGAVHVPSDLWVIRFAAPGDGGIREDLNGDLLVNTTDLFMLLGAWGSCPENQPCDADLDGNGAVDVFDLMQLLGAWGG